MTKTFLDIQYTFGTRVNVDNFSIDKWRFYHANVFYALDVYYNKNKKESKISKQYIEMCKEIKKSNADDDKYIKVPEKMYLNNALIEDINYLNTYIDSILKSFDIIEKHDKIIKNINKHLGSINCCNETKFGWMNRSLKLKLMFYKYKNIDKTNPEIYIDNKLINIDCDNDETSVENFIINTIINMIEEKDIKNYLNNIEVENTTFNSKRQEYTEKKVEIKDDLYNKENFILEQSLKSRNREFLFLKFSKKVMMEYISCKKYDEDEIQFYKTLVEN